MEALVGLALSVTVTMGAVAVITQTASTKQNSDLQYWLNNLYYQSVHVARSTNTMKQVIPSFPGIEACLAGKGVNCTAYSGTAYPLNVVEGLNGIYSPEGLCVSASPLCRIRLTTNYRWVCESVSCAKMIISVDATILNENGQPDTNFRSRSGEFPLNAKLFQERGQIAYTCKTGTQQTLYGFDYENLEARCSSYDGGLACGNPMRIFGGSLTENCQPPQPDACGEGYGIVGLYTAQRACSPPRGFWAAGPPSTEPFPAYPYYPVEPPPHPAELWTWQAAMSQVTCTTTTMMCGGLQMVTCAGLNCPGNTYWHYMTTTNPTVPGWAPGSTTTSRPPFIGGIYSIRID